MVLLFDSKSVTKYLTVNQRILINQERAFIMQGRDEAECFAQPDELERKIQFVLTVISNRNMYEAYEYAAQDIFKY